jgi:hypothetical protein
VTHISNASKPLISGYYQSLAKAEKADRLCRVHKVSHGFWVSGLCLASLVRV